MIFDFLDGFSARALKAYSPIGEQLDSMADLISFGFMPAALIYQFGVEYAYRMGDCYGLPAGLDVPDKLISTFPITTFALPEHLIFALPVFLFTAFAALRLAKFNIDDDQTDSFSGLASPAAAAFLIGLYPLHMGAIPALNGILFQPLVVFGIPILVGVMMILRYPMFAFKSFNGSKRDKLFQLILILVAVISIIVFKFAALSIIVLTYIFLSVIKNILKNELHS